MYAGMAPYYDAIYAARGKDYARESERLHALIQQHTRAPGRALVDVACGTGGHLGHLRRHYDVEGLDLDPSMLAIARRKHPDLIFHQASMEEFDLGCRFDVLVCLFSAIAYTMTVPRLTRTLQTMARHVRPGGLVIVEPFITPDRVLPGHVSADFVDQPELKIARMNVSRVEGRTFIMDFHFLVATPAGVRHFTERHDVALFTRAECLQAFEAAGLQVTYDPEGLIGRGLYVGWKPVERG